MARVLNELSKRISLHIDVAIHAYDLRILQWELDNLPNIFGDRRIVATEVGMELVMKQNGRIVPRPGAMQELEAMLKLAKDKNILLMAHEFKSNKELAAQAEYTGGFYSMAKGDKRLNLYEKYQKDRINALKQNNVNNLAQVPTTQS